MDCQVKAKDGLSARLQPLFSYRARILLGEYDWNHPEANTALIGLKARSAEQAGAMAIWVTGKPVMEVWRQDRGEWLEFFLPCDAGYPVGTSAAEWARQLLHTQNLDFALGRMDAEPDTIEPIERAIAVAAL